MSSRRRDQRLARSKRNRAAAISATLVVIVLGGFVVRAAARVNPALDDDLCPADITLIPGMMLMLVDATDPWTGLRRTAVAREVAEVTESVPRHTRVIVHVVRGGAGDWMAVADPIARICNPGTPAQVASDADDAGFPGLLSALVSNPERARARYDGAFGRVIDSLVSRAGQAAPQDHSPILETIRSAVLSEQFEGLRTLVLISDMYQNSPLCSFYGEPRCLDRIDDPTIAGTHDLRGASVEILLLTPANGEFVPRETLLQFWHNYFARQGALITRVKRIEQ
jgi:hypothetical protein